MSSTPGRPAGSDEPRDALRTPSSTATLTDRLHRLSEQAGIHGIDVVVVSPGADMRYLVGHAVASHERLTCLVIPAAADPVLVVPTLERPGWNDTAAERLGISIVTWTDGADPYAVVAELLPSTARAVAVDNYLPAVHALGLRAAIPGSELTLAGAAIADLRMRKDADEVAALLAVGAAIDQVHARVAEWLRPGRTEREVAADIGAAIVAAGHTTADFVIVGSGPNGASPHHEASDRVVQQGELVVIDIGGPSPAGYYSDCTRTYLTGPAKDPQAAEVYEVVRAAQAAGVAAVRPGVSAESVDAASRRVIEDAGYGEYFITRTGHGIGLEVHEHPYVVSGNETALEPGMAFSVEPGIYLPGRFGVRIEDVVIVTEDGGLLANRAPTALTVLG